MSLTYKSILDDLKNGKIATGITTTDKKAWYKYCYHFSHIDNIISVLKDEHLYSRSMAEAKGKVKHDNASLEIIEQTDQKFKKYVRLYFRPRTPTQYHNEGFKTKSQLTAGSLNAHCPLPVFLFFNLEKVLEHTGVRFSSKTLAARGETPLYSTPEEFSKLPFDKIYHDNPVSPAEKKDIVSHRQAEIIIRDSLEINNYLSKIFVRSVAEKETLLSLMDNQLKDKYANLIQIDTRKIVFFGDRIYIDEVVLHSDKITMKNIESSYNTNPIIFDLKFELVDKSGKKFEHEIRKWQFKNDITFNFKSIYDEYELTIRFDGFLMYSGYYRYENNIPY